jgi:hypothetical protein
VSKRIAIMSKTILSLRDVIRVYVGATASFGFVRAVTYDYNPMRSYFNKQTREFENKEMLVVDKVGMIVAKSISAPALWPLMVHGDLARLECWLTGKRIDEYT